MPRFGADLAAYFVWLHRSTRYAERRRPQTQERLGPLLAGALPTASIAFLACCFGHLISPAREINWLEVIAGMFIGPTIVITAILILWQRDREREGHRRPDCTCPACIEAAQRRQVRSIEKR